MLALGKRWFECKISTPVSYFSLVIFGLTAVYLLLFSSSLAAAQVPGIEPGETLEQPKTRSSVVTASVPDIVSPSVPVLISPINNAVLTNSQISYVFQASTDNVGVDHYQIWIDGTVLFANLNPAGELTSGYTLVVSGDRLTLTPTQRQSDGTHTWKIVAVDTAGNLASSATWQYSLDTQAPTFIITLIDDQTVNISAQDLLTIPTEPINLVNDRPVLSGVGEANSTGVISIVIPGQTTQLLTFTIDSAGQWQAQLPTLPFDQVILLNFTITDQAGNVNVISDLPLILLSTPTEIFPPGMITTSPQITPPVYPSPPPFWPEQPLWPDLPLPSPVQPLIDQIYRLGQTPRALLAQMMPISMEATWQEPRLSILNPFLLLLSGLGWLWIILPALVTLIWLSRSLPQAFTRNGLKQLWWAIDFRHGQEPRGAVFFMPSLQPLPFASLTVISRLKSGQTQVSYRLANQWGEYLPDDLQSGSHTISINTPGTVFPAVFNVPTHSLFGTYYLGEEWDTDSAQVEPYLLIPVLKTDQSPRRQPPGWLLKVTHHQGKATVGQLALVLLTVAILPSLLNLMALVVLVLLMSETVLGKGRKRTRLAEVYNRNQELINQGALILHSDQDTQIQVIRAGVVGRPIKKSLLNQDKQWCQAVVTDNQGTLISEKSCSIEKSRLVV